MQPLITLLEQHLLYWDIFFSLQTVTKTKRLLLTANTQRTYGRWKCSHTWILKNFLCHCFAPGRRVGWKASSFILNLTGTRVGVPRRLTLTELLSNFFNEEEFLFEPCCKQKTAAVNALSGKGLRMRYGLSEVKGKTSVIFTPFFPPPQFL